MKKIKNISVDVLFGDMATITADAYIVPQFNSCVSYGGVGGSIARSGASVGMEAYDKIIASGQNSFGSAFIVPAGGGNSQYLVHVISVGSGQEQEFETVQKSVYSALKLADEAGAESILCPALGTSIIGDLSDEQSAKAVFSAVAKFSEIATSVKRFSLVIFRTGTLVFEKVLNSESYLKEEPVIGRREFNFEGWINGIVTDLDNNYQKFAQQ